MRHIFGGLLYSIFIMADVGNLIEKVTDSMTIMIRVVRLIAECF